jgi:hypothetical protein
MKLSRQRTITLHRVAQHVSDPLEWLLALDGLPSAYSASRDGIDVMLRDRGLRRTRPEQTAESLLRGAHASAVLEGSANDLDQVRAGAADATAAAALRVSTQLLGLVPVIKQTPMQVFARLHALAGKGEVDDAELGRPVGPDAAKRLQTLSRSMLVTKIPGLMVAALVHAELATLSPFASHNGIVARAAERLVIVSRGVDPASLVVPEMGHLKLRREYESNLRAYASGRQSGLHAWLSYAAEAYTLGAESSPLLG